MRLARYCTLRPHLDPVVFRRDGAVARVLARLS
jgi:hypothetical protein